MIKFCTHPAGARRYLYSVKPIVTPEQYEATAKLVEDFRTGQGKELQAALVAHDAANKHTSYISGALRDGAAAVQSLHSPTPRPQACGLTCIWRTETPSR